MFTLSAPFSFEQTIKKSLFIVYAAPVQTAQEAIDFFASKHQADATHNCWAYKLAQNYRFNDDGEPGGTAGRPILQSIEGQDLINVAVLVIRYFGGIKLGTGGLIRAYGGSAAKCLQIAPREEIIPATMIICEVDFADMAMLRSRLLLPETILLDEVFNERGAVWTLSIPTQLINELEQHYINITRGQGVWMGPEVVEVKD